MGQEDDDDKTKRKTLDDNERKMTDPGGAGENSLEDTKEEDGRTAAKVKDKDDKDVSETAASETALVNQEESNPNARATHDTDSMDRKQLKAVAATILRTPLPPEKEQVAAQSDTALFKSINVHNLPKCPPAEARVMDAKIRFQNEINPLPNPLPIPSEPSRPGAYAFSRNLIPPSPPSPPPQEEEEEDQDGREIAIEDNATVVSGLTLDVTVQHSLPIAAELVEDHESRIQEMEQQIRQEFERKIQEEYVRKSQADDRNSNPIVNAVPATSVVNPVEEEPYEEKDSNGRSKYVLGGLLLLLLLVIVAIVIGITLAPDKATNVDDIESQNDGPSTVDTDDNYRHDLLPVLQIIQLRGYLKCEVPQVEQDQGFGFTIDLCKAIAAAIFSNSSRFERTDFTWAEHFRAIHDGRLDVSAAHISLNMQRDVREPNAQTGFTYSTPYLYTGTGLAGIPTFVKCAEDAETFEGECRDLQVCVTTGTVTQDFVEAHLPGTATVLVKDDIELMTQFVSGTCNVMSADAISLSEQRARVAGYDGEYVISDRLLSHEHLALLTRESDPEWAQFCDWILRALITAEALNITQENAEQIGATELFGPDYTQMFIQAIAAVGNYGEIYERNYGGILPRSPYNQINTGETGLIVSDPFASLMIDQWSTNNQELPHPVVGGTMEAVYIRGMLVCGVILQDEHGNPRAGFAEYNQSSGEWSGMDVDYCRGIAAAVGAGKEIETVFVNVTNSQTRYVALENATLDILAGEPFSMSVDVREQTTGTGFTFSTPYFYYNKTISQGGASLALATREDDPQWSDLVNWIVVATIYAEEKRITLENAADMPVVELFGQPHRQMFRDAIHAIGNYKEIYQRNLARLFPRSDRNLLNEDYTPQFYPIIPFHPTAK